MWFLVGGLRKQSRSVRKGGQLAAEEKRCQIGKKTLLSSCRLLGQRESSVLGLWVTRVGRTSEEERCWWKCEATASTLRNGDHVGNLNKANLLA